ncbi:DNA-directed RNA polymerase subunit N [Candidatus Micrarchaeota archaeon]|nr:MAG: DNA-directed RNA polymerase subunit N [Candidatus Micrarchaeota archaeon]
MLIPIRCFSCGRPIAQHWEVYKSRIEKGEDPGKVLDDLGVHSYCCRRMFIGHRDIMPKLLDYSI